MTIQLMHKVYDGKCYLERYGDLIGNQISEDQLRAYTHLDSLSDLNHIDAGLRAYIIKDGGSFYPTLPVLNPKNTAQLADELIGLAESTCPQIAQNISEITAILGERWQDEAHNLMVHVVLENLWQSIWGQLLAPDCCGNPVIFDSLEECSVLTTQVLPLSEAHMVAYWQNNLQESNWVMTRAFNNKYMLKMLRSMDEDGFMLPAGGVESQLLEMKLIRKGRMNGSQVPTYKMAVPTISIDQIRAIRQPLRDMARLGRATMGTVKDLLLKTRANQPGNMKYVSQELYLQACFSIWSYAAYRAWLGQGIIAKPIRVPVLFEKMRG